MNNIDRRQFMRLSGKWALLGLGLPPVMASLASGCKTMEVATQLGTAVGVGSGYISSSQANAITRSTKAVAKTFQDITPEQEYYIGRTIGAVILQKYRPYPDAFANRYVNILGRTLSQASDRPETYGGYHFLIQDSQDINAFAAPGGFIFVTRGMLQCCRHEDALAAVLAHEIGHVQFKHGLQAIQKSRITSALTILAAEGAKAAAGEDLAQLTSAFEDSIADITKTMINNGYSRSFEREADQAAVTILSRVGYNPSGLNDMLEVMSKRLKPGGFDFAKTHPSPLDRMAEVTRYTGRYKQIKRPLHRQARFERFMGSV
jgi:predicted Zn-dependent protease